MQFGNWNITDTAIEWNGEETEQFSIELKQLLDTTTDKASGDTVYACILRATNEDWLAEDDLYDLNFAVAFAAGASGQSFDYAIFDQTLEHQYNMLEDEEHCK